MGCEMTDSEQLTVLLKLLKEYAEKEHCYDKYGDDFNPNDYTHGDDAFDVGSEFGEILFARTLLEQIGVEFEYPILKEND
jgi:hypothetical protein